MIPRKYFPASNWPLKIAEGLAIHCKSKQVSFYYAFHLHSYSYSPEAASMKNYSLRQMGQKGIHRNHGSQALEKWILERKEIEDWEKDTSSFWYLVSHNYLFRFPVLVQPAFTSQKDDSINDRVASIVCTYCKICETLCKIELEQLMLQKKKICSTVYSKNDREDHKWCS